MKKKVFILIIIVIGLFLVYNTSSSTDKTIFNVSSEGPLDLKAIVENLKTDGYNENTVQWMESLGEKKVFMSSDEIIIMDSYDASKIPSVYANDAYLNEIFSCDVVENHSLKNNSYLKENVVYVKNVEYLTEELHYPDI